MSPRGPGPKAAPAVAIVGAGRAACALARGLALASVEVLVWARRPAAARALARGAGKQVRVVQRPAQLAGAAILVLAVSDPSIERVASELTQALGAGRGRTALHLSGYHSSELLAPLARLGWRTASLHPLLALAERGRAEQLGGALFAVEGSPPARRVATDLAHRLGGEVIAIAPRDKAAYHAAATSVAGGTVALAALAARLYPGRGREAARLRAGFARLAQSALENVARLGPARALSGPARRGDRAVLGGHERALSALAPEWSRLHRALVERMLALAAETRRPAERRGRGARGHSS